MKAGDSVTFEATHGVLNGFRPVTKRGVVESVEGGKVTVRTLAGARYTLSVSVVRVTAPTGTGDAGEGARHD